jgi:tetratricopeptide (TPR) repeat protein
MRARDAFFQTVAQISAERDAARPVVDDLRSSLGSLWEDDLPASWRTAGFVQELTTAAAEILEHDPRRSLGLAQLALAVATSIPPDTYPVPVQAQVEGTAWKEIGNAHRYLSEYDAALRAFDSAQRCLADSSTLGHDRAVVEFARAVVLSDIGKQDEARELISDVIPILRSYADQRRLVHAALLIGNIDVRERRLPEARAVFEQALRDISSDDLYGRAALYSNLAQVCTDMGDINEALLMFHNSRAILSELGMTAAVTRTEWALAQVLLRNGQFHHAIPILQRIRDIFMQNGMIDDAGLTGLDLAESLLAIDRRDEARVVTERVLGEFVKAGLNARAITAVAYLKDMLPAGPEGQRAVRHVRIYLEKLRSEPALAFLPLPEER